MVVGNVSVCSLRAGTRVSIDSEGQQAAGDIDTAHPIPTGGHLAGCAGAWAEPTSIHLPGGREGGHELA